MKRTKSPNWITRLEGYLLIPHELLHVAGFWLVGRQCHYRWGQPFVTPLESMARWQHLVGCLFPFVIFGLLSLILALLTPVVYSYARQNDAWLWLALLLILLQITGLYLGSTLLDLRNAYLLIVNKPWHSRTPFDIFLWPIVDWEKVRQSVIRGENDVK